MADGKRVLVVEDDVDIRDAIRTVLEDAGYAVETAENGRDALAKLAAQPAPALMLLDLMMPVLDGWAFIEVRRADPVLAAIPVVLLSATAGPSRVAPYAGIAALLSKPVDADALLAAVAKHAR